MKFTIGDKVQFINKTGEKQSGRTSTPPKINVTYTINNCAFDRNNLKNYYSLTEHNTTKEIFWIHEEDLI